ncbi:MAG: rhomboid family intramembrane serine protease [Opitutales bacterium]
MTNHRVVASEKDLLPGLPVPEDFDPPPGWSPVAVFASTQQAHEAGLAILAMGQAYWLLPHEDAYTICVAEANLPAVRRELETMQRLGGRTRPRHREQPPYQELRVSQWSFVLYGLLLSLCFAAQFYFPIKSAGRVDAVRMVENGEWWRAVTALTLHGDIVHLVSNLVAGIGFAFLLARFFGAGAAWLLILLSGAAGNVLNAWVHHPEAHLSVGASTAVFGGLGLMTGIGLWVALMQPGERWTMPRWLLPAFGGLTLLGLLGIGDGLDARIDVAAHISGFFCGGVGGFLCATRQAAFVRLDRYGRWIGLVTLMLIGVAWLAALFI